MCGGRHPGSERLTNSIHQPPGPTWWRSSSFALSIAKARAWRRTLRCCSTPAAASASLPAPPPPLGWCSCCFSSPGSSCMPPSDCAAAAAAARAGRPRRRRPPLLFSRAGMAAASSSMKASMWAVQRRSQAGTGMPHWPGTPSVSRQSPRPWRRRRASSSAVGCGSAAIRSSRWQRSRKLWCARAYCRTSQLGRQQAW